MTLTPPTHVGRLSRTADKSVAHNVVINAPNPDFLLEPGMAATVAIVVDQRANVLRAPDQALQYTPTGHLALSSCAGSKEPPDATSQIWVLRDNKPVAVPIRLGLSDGAYTEIVRGDVRPGDELIVGESKILLEAPAARRL